MDAQRNGQESPRQNFEKGKTPEGTVTLPNYGYCVGIIPLRSTRDLRDFQNRNILILLGHQVISRDFQKMNFRNLLGNNKTSSRQCWASWFSICFLLFLHCIHYDFPIGLNEIKCLLLSIFRAGGKIKKILGYIALMEQDPPFSRRHKGNKPFYNTGKIFVSKGSCGLNSW